MDAGLRGQRLTATELVGVVAGGLLLALQNFQARGHADTKASAAEAKASSLGTNLGPRVQDLEARVATVEARLEIANGTRRRR